MIKLSTEAKNLKPILVLLGVTASGKSKVALHLAKEFNGEIISSDSIQVYRRLNIGSAKPTLAELKSANHHLIDILDPNQNYNAGKFLTLAEKSLQDIYNKKKTPIVISGNMLYVRSLLYGLAEIPPIAKSIKEEVNQLYQKGIENCYKKLITLDPLVKGILNPVDKSRILRALEVFLATNKSIVTFQNEHKFKKLNYQPIFLEIKLEKELACKRIDERVLKMFQNGLIEEVQGLLGDYCHTVPALQSIGYKQVSKFLNGETSKKDMIVEIQNKSRQYAKRQRTWFKRIENTYKLEYENFFIKSRLQFLKNLLIN